MYKLFRLHHYHDWPEYGEESWRLEETCCHSNSNEKSSANDRIKKLSKD